MLNDYDFDDDLSGRVAEPRPSLRPLAWGLAIGGLVFGSLMLWALRAQAHADGEQIYDWLCCANHDCAPVPPADVDASASGWIYKPTGEIIPFEDSSRIKRSTDGRFHICRPQSGLRCIYIPQLS